MAHYDNYTTYQPSLLSGLVIDLDAADARAMDAGISFNSSATHAGRTYQSNEYVFQPAGLGAPAYGSQYVHSALAGAQYSSAIFQQPYMPAQVQRPTENDNRQQFSAYGARNLDTSRPAGTTRPVHSTRPVQSIQSVRSTRPAQPLAPQCAPRPKVDVDLTQEDGFSPSTQPPLNLHIHAATYQPVLKDIRRSDTGPSKGRAVTEKPSKASATTKRPQKPAEIRTQRQLTSTTKAVYDSVLFRYPQVVMGWRDAPFGYTDKEIMHILQYLEQVTQLRGQAQVDQILQRRRPEVIEQQRWEQLDDYDPLRVFNGIWTQERRGVPPVGYVLDTEIVGDRPFIDDTQPTPVKKADPSHQLHGHTKHWECVPVGASCWEMLQDYPNHLAYEFLDAFLQHKIPAGEIVRGIRKSVMKELQRCVISRQKPNNCYKKRLDKRMRVLAAKTGYDYARVDAYIKSPLRLRELGFTPNTWDQRSADVHLVQEKIDGEASRHGAWLKDQKEAKEGADRQTLSDPFSSSTTPTTLQSASASPPVENDVSSNAAQNTHPFVPNNVPSAVQPPSTKKKPYGTQEASRAQLSATASPPLDTHHLSGIVNFSASITADGFGHVGGTQLWSSRRDYVRHVEQILALNTNSKRLFTLIGEHDEGIAGLDRAQKNKHRNAVLVFLFNAQAGKRYRPEDPSVQSPASGSMDVDAVLSQIEAEIAMFLQDHPDLNMPNPSHTQVERLKQTVLAHQVDFHKTITQALASVVSMVLLGIRNDLVNDCKAHVVLESARLLVSNTENAIAAQCLKKSSMKQRFRYSDELKNAMACDIIQDVQLAHGMEQDDISFLLAMQKVTKTAKETMMSAYLSKDRPTIPLSPALMSTAESQYDEILEQIEDELKNLRIGPSADRLRTKKHHRTEEAKGDKSGDEHPDRPAKRRRGGEEDLSMQVNVANAKERHQTVRIGPHQNDEQRQYTDPKQHQNVAGKVPGSKPTSNAVSEPEKTQHVQKPTTSSAVHSTPNLSRVSPQMDSSPVIMPASQENGAPGSSKAEHRDSSTSHVHFDEEVASYENELPEDFREMPQASVHDEAPSSGAYEASDSSPRPSSKKRERDDEEDLDLDEPSRKSPRLELSALESFLATSELPAGNQPTAAGDGFDEILRQFEEDSGIDDPALNFDFFDQMHGQNQDLDFGGFRHVSGGGNQVGDDSACATNMYYDTLDNNEMAKIT